MSPGWPGAACSRLVPAACGLTSEELAAWGSSCSLSPARLSTLPAFLVAAWLPVTPGSNILGLLRLPSWLYSGLPGLVKAKMPTLQPALSIQCIRQPSFYKRDGPFGGALSGRGGAGHVGFSRSGLCCVIFC